MIIAGYIATLFMGLSLGLLGGGGSILTVPILVYLFKLPADQAIQLSFLVVGTTSAIAVLPAPVRKDVRLQIVAYFGIPSVATIFLMRRFVIPLLPAQIAGIEKGEALMILFALVMLIAAVAMLWPSKSAELGMQVRPATLSAIGISVGVLAGLIGAGGGFIIVPVLMRFARLNLREAIATALAVISINSLVAYFAGGNPSGEVGFLAVTLVALAIAGALAGSWIGRRVKSENLKPAFGYFILVMGFFVLGEHFLK